MRFAWPLTPKPSPKHQLTRGRRCPSPDDVVVSLGRTLRCQRDQSKLRAEPERRLDQRGSIRAARPPGNGRKTPAPPPGRGAGHRQPSPVRSAQLREIEAARTENPRRPEQVNRVRRIPPAMSQRSSPGSPNEQATSEPMSSPEAPGQPTQTCDTRMDIANAMTWSIKRLWMTARRPLRFVPMKSRTTATPCSKLGTRAKPMIGACCAMANGSSRPTRSIGATRIPVYSERVSARGGRSARRSGRATPAVQRRRRTGSRAAARPHRLFAIAAGPGERLQQPVSNRLFGENDALRIAIRTAVERLRLDDFPGGSLAVGAGVDQRRDCARARLGRRAVAGPRQPGRVQPAASMTSDTRFDWASSSIARGWTDR